MNTQPQALQNELGQESEPTPQRVICRPQRSNWLGVALLLVMAAMVWALPMIPRGNGLPPLSPRDRLAIWAATSLIWMPCLAGAVWLSLWIRRAAIVADSEKVMWRGIRGARGTRGAFWNEVTDYYFTRVKSTTKYTIQTPQGRLSFGGSWTNEPELADWIVRHAKNAGTSEWQLKDARDNAPWPRRFHYRSFENCWMLPLMPFVGLLYPWQCWLEKACEAHRSCSQSAKSPLCTAGPWLR